MFACRAWVNFTGVGAVLIRGSGNVSSITDGGVGRYTVNFTTNMQDADYCATLAYSSEANVQTGIGVLVSITVGAVTVDHYNAANNANTVDKTIICIAIFR